ncbi:glucose 1-dehydrogenase [Rhodococcus opacus]|uniref:glucose 1-dehydrogenase n=1 Tax=Rhodococcus opacus TaxID=37919 RepID=UPI0024738AD1|nr:glucose 1-dehydrogenase [Rhodococcus opacus]MDH6291334.1 3alpha(or 20beta)-hydroxysteroid dehydrogenase [Rhodococcus opacus]
MSRRFDARTVLISGGARGMGASHAAGFLEEGANVVIGDVRDDEGGELVSKLGERARYVHLDVSDPDQWTDAVAVAEATFGPVSVLVNNAGFGGRDTLVDTSPDEWRRVLSVNLDGSFYGIRATVPSMRRFGGGAIVNTSSYAGLAGTPLNGSYAASKFALRGLTRTAAFELAADNIRVNSIHPGYIQTPLIAGVSPEAVGLQKKLAMPRFGQPEEVTKMVLFVCSDDASYSTGAEFVVDGGWSAGSPIPVRGSEPLGSL